LLQFIALYVPFAGLPGLTVSTTQRAAPLCEREFHDFASAQLQFTPSNRQAAPFPVWQVLPLGAAVHCALAEKGVSRLKNIRSGINRMYLTAARSSFVF